MKKILISLIFIVSSSSFANSIMGFETEKFDSRMEIPISENSNIYDGNDIRLIPMTEEGCSRHIDVFVGAARLGRYIPTPRCRYTQDDIIGLAKYLSEYWAGKQVYIEKNQKYDLLISKFVILKN